MRRLGRWFLNGVTALWLGLTKARLAVRRWLALLRLPIMARRESYLHFTYDVRFTGTWEVVRVYQLRGRIWLDVRTVGMLDDPLQYKAEITREARDELFGWLREYLGARQTVFKIFLGHDHGVLELHGSDAGFGWRCAVYISGLHHMTDLRSLRFDLLNKVKSMM